MKISRKWILVAALVLSVAMASSGTIAYLSDEASAVNVMTLGSVKIEQIEQERGEDGKLVDFSQGKPALPAVGPIAWADAGKGAIVNGTEYLVFTEDLKNVIDKIVTVKNTGKSDAFVRTIIAIEAPDYDPNNLIHVNVSPDGLTQTSWTPVDIDGVNYVYSVFTYDEALAPNEISTPSLMQLFLDSDADNEDCAKFGDTWEVLVLSQAVQADGFSDAATALDAAFGKITADNHPWMDNPPTKPVTVYTAAELQKALDDATDGAIILLGDDIEGDVTATQKPDVKVTLEGCGYTFDGFLTVDGKSATILTAGLTVKNVNFKADSISADACINLGEEGNNNTRYTCNVTVENCTFDVPGAVGVKSYTGGDKNLKIIGCTVTENAHSLVQAKGIDGILVENCTVKSKNGLNFNNSDNVEVIGCEVDVKGYAVRFGESSGGVGAAETYLIKDCALKSANADGDATIILRGTADNSTLTIVNTTIVGTPDITNTATGATVIK
ncbi:MAG: hypothetical protein E7324_10660 [Clostridiales bacterium]|nr:hypothetical protein [Clostridiales bacterium]